MAYSPQHYNILLAHMLKSPAVMSLAAKNLKPAFFTHASIGGSYTQAVLFEIITDHSTKFSVPPDPAVLMVESRRILTNFLTPDQRDQSLREVISFIKLVSVVDERSLGLAKQLINYMHQVCVKQEAVAEAAEELAAGTPITEIGNRLLEIQRKSQSLLGTSAVNGISQVKLSVGDRELTGIPFLDSRLGAGSGPVRGSGIGLISPQGGGKTTFGIQLAISQSLLGKSTLLVLAEEGLTRTVRRNLIACAVGIPTTVLEKFENADGILNVPEVARTSGVDPELAAAKLGQLDKNLHVLDLNERPGNLDDIVNEIQVMADSGSVPNYVYIDWAGILADRMLATGMSGVKFDNKYQALKAISYNVMATANRFNNLIAVAQQMAPAIASRGALKVHDTFCAADCRGFTEPFKYVFTISGRDPKTRLSVCSIVKARNDPAGVRFPLMLHGPLAQFEDMSHKFSVDKTRIKPTSSDSKPVVPKEGTGA
jgi:hypothetical protein